MTALNLANTETTARARIPQPLIEELAERCLRRNPYLALRNVSSDYQNGVLTLRGCLPSYYLKQVAQQAVVHLEGVQHVDNQIEVVTPACRSARSQGWQRFRKAVASGGRVRPGHDQGAV